MDAEIVFSGLCSFLNVSGKNRSMGDPSVIAVQDNDNGHEHDDPKARASHRHDPHIAFLAFRKSEVQVDDDRGFVDILPSREFMYLPLEGKELTIVDNPPGVPKVDPSYERVVRKDDYWPEVRDQWNPDYVAPMGSRPKKSAVKAFMRFGNGLVSADRISLVEWEFPMRNGGVYRGHFAEEVIYSGFPHSGDAIVIRLTDLPDGENGHDRHAPAHAAEAQTLRFTLRPGTSAQKVTLFIGNLMASDIESAVRREVTTRVATGDHFKYLNRVAAVMHGDGPIPVGNNPPETNRPYGGGASGGICGPGSGNGRP